MYIILKICRLVFHLPRCLHCVPGVSGLSQKYAFFKKSTIFILSLRNLTEEGTREDLFLAKFRNDQIKIVDFLIRAYF